jgi:hypothetical protein
MTQRFADLPWYNGVIPCQILDTDKLKISDFVML